MKRRRILLFGVAGLLCASALLAIAILLVGRFGYTERRIVATTLLLAGYGLLSLPAVVLLDQRRLRAFAFAAVGAAAAAAVTALVSIWAPSSSDTVGKLVGTLTVAAVAAAQAAALAGRRRESDPPVVGILFDVSCATAALAAASASALIWTQPSGSTYVRLLGALIVLDLLLVSLQPVLARALLGTSPRARPPHQPLPR